ncbi:MAG: hypothetical protein IKP06_06400 [Elusimicrobiaceae bacterium]|nr:hypothetical protein [Elusimicrobiaceae bacterium]
MKKWTILYFCIVLGTLAIVLKCREPEQHIILFVSILDIIFAYFWFRFFWLYEFFKRAIIVPGKVIDFEKHDWWRDECNPRFIGRRRSWVEIVAFEFDGEQGETYGNFVRWPFLFKPDLGTPREVGIDPLTGDARVFGNKKESIFWMIFFAFVPLCAIML